MPNLYFQFHLRKKNREIKRARRNGGRKGMRDGGREGVRLVDHRNISALYLCTLNTHIWPYSYPLSGSNVRCWVYFLNTPVPHLGLLLCIFEKSWKRSSLFHKVYKLMMFSFLYFSTSYFFFLLWSLTEHENKAVEWKQGLPGISCHECSKMI